MALSQDDWDRHWDDYAESAERNPAQVYRRRLIIGRLGRGPARIVDLGSGQGDLARSLLSHFPTAKVLGVEGSRSGVETAVRKVPGAAFVQRDLLDVAESPGRYAGWATHAVCSEVLEHVDEPVLLLRSARAYMGPGCRLVVTVPGGPMSAFDRHIGHRRHYGAAELRSLLESAGFEVEEVARAGFPFFDVYRLLVILRGRKLVADVSSGQGGSAAARLVMSSFRLLFALNLRSSPLGWQLAATARLADGRAKGGSDRR